MRILVVADSDVLAATIEAALRDQGDVRVAALRPRGIEHLIDEHDPAVVVLAATAARVDSALESLGNLRMPPVIVLVDDAQSAWTPAARRAGVQAVLALDSSADQINATLAAVNSGLIALHPDVFHPVPRSSVDSADEVRALTIREREILDMMAEGLSNRAIAGRLAISAYTVKFHVASILAKLHAGSRTEAVTLGLRTGLISL